VLREEDVLQHLIDTEALGLADLRQYEVPDEVKRATDLEVCWATWSAPFDREDDYHLVATAYYLSPAVRTFWEKRLGGPVLWFGTTLEAIADYLEKLEGELAAAPKPAA